LIDSVSYYQILAAAEIVLMLFPIPAADPKSDVHAGAKNGIESTQYGALG